MRFSATSHHRIAAAPPARKSRAQLQPRRRMIGGIAERVQVAQ